MSKNNLTPANLESYSFLWSQARLLIAAVALFIGGIPPVLAFNPFPALAGTLSSLLTLAWIISGVASAYLIYRWFDNKQKLFGKNDPKDLIAFLVAVVSGLNLGLAGVLGTNLGMSIASTQIVFITTGIIYLTAFLRLFRRWNESGQKLFD